MNLFNKDFIEYIDLLNKYEVTYILVGGMAVNLHGYRRSTGDMDIFINPTPENHLRLRRVHHEFGMHMGEMELLMNFLDTTKYDVFTFGSSPVQIDILTACKGIEFNEAYNKAVRIELIDNIFVYLVDYRSLIAAKKAANRLRDQADIEELEKLKNKKDISGK